MQLKSIRKYKKIIYYELLKCSIHEFNVCTFFYIYNILNNEKI